MRKNPYKLATHSVGEPKQISSREEYGYNRYLDSLHLKASELFTLQTEAEFKLKFEIAQNLLAIGLSVEEIARATGLLVAQVEDLKSGL